MDQIDNGSNRVETNITSTAYDTALWAEASASGSSDESYNDSYEESTMSSKHVVACAAVEVFRETTVHV